MAGSAVAKSGRIAISYLGASFGSTCPCKIPALVSQAFFAQVAKLFLAGVIDLDDALARCPSVWAARFAGCPTHRSRMSSAMWKYILLLVSATCLLKASLCGMPLKTPT
eukprot:8309186-Pyramimonas_sp.AAC.1